MLRRFLFATALTAMCLIGSLQADEPFLRFSEGLRNRGYYDTALEYLDSISARTDLPQDVREVLDLERGLTQQLKGAASRVPEDRDQAFSDAEAALRKFIADSPQHAQAALANSMLGEILFERARSLIWKTADLEDAAKRTESQQAARTIIDQAKAIYQTAQDQYKAAYDAFPKFIDESRDEEQYNLRREAEAKYLRAWFNLVRCTYERGQTFDKGTEERRKTLIQAAELFEQIHTSRRTNQIGLHARLMMGKCFQEQDDLGRALGIYNEMLGHPSNNPAVQMLKGIAQHYRLICLNDPQKSDYQLVVQEASAWLQSNRQQSTSTYGLGILWEKAIAQEKLGTSRELPQRERETILRAALNDAQQVGKYPGPYKDAASAMGRRLALELGDRDRDPRTFSAAFERARGMIAQIQQLSDELAAAADPGERATKKSALDNHLSEVGRLLQLALDLRETDSDPKAIAQARYLLSFVRLREGKSLDAMILATYCLVHDAKTDPDTALNATEIAMAASVAAWNAAPASDRSFETRALRDVCLRIVELYPQSSRGGEARMRLGSAYRTMNQPIEAAGWFVQVPETDPQYGSARMSAGQAYWAAWTQKAALAALDPDSGDAPSPELDTWKSEARNLLTQGIQITRQKLGDAATPTEELLAAEVSLSTIQNLDGDFAATIDRLTKGGENSVVQAVDVPAGTTRPEEGIQGKSFASLTYRLLLRAYIGTQQIDQALQIMSKLERVGGDDIIAAYTQLGIELQEELRRLQAAGQIERLAQVRDSFEKFLQKVYESRDKTDYNSLLWIGETYYGLGQGVSADPSSAEAYYSRAADAYSEILNGGLANEASKGAVQLRLARCRRQQKKFEEALGICEEILTRNPMTLDVQFEAAYVLSDWGANGDPEKFTDAIQGKKDASGSPSAVWGWLQLTRRLQQISAKDPSEELKSRFIDARYELTNTRRRFAEFAGADADKHRRSALAEITSFVQVQSSLDDLSFARFDRLYQDLQADLGQAPTPLERTVVEEFLPEEPSAPAEAPQAVAQTVPTAETPESGGGGLLLPIIGVSVCIALAAGFVWFMRRPKERVRIPGPAVAPKFSAVSSGVSTAAATGVPEGLDFAAPAIGDFSGISVGKPRKTAVASKPPAAKASADDSVTSSPPRPVVRPASSGSDSAASGSAPRKGPSDASEKPRTAAPASPSKPAPAKGATGATPGQKPGAPRKPSSGEPGTAPRPRPPGDPSASPKPAPQKRPKPPTSEGA